MNLSGCHSIPTKTKGIVLLKTISQGMLELFIKSMTQSLDSACQTVYLYDARYAATSPLAWCRSVTQNTGNNIHGNSNVEQIINSFLIPENHVSIVLNANHLNCFENFPGCRNFYNALDADEFGGLWFLNFPSLENFPGELKWRVHELHPLNPAEMREYLAEYGLYPSEPALTAVHNLTAGFPEYIDPLFKEILTDPSPGSLAHSVDAELADPLSLLSVLCENRWKQVLLFARGFGNIKAVIEHLALEPGLRLVDLAGKMNNSLPAVRDYIRATARTGIIRIHRKRYSLVDPMLARWLTHRKQTSIQKIEIEKATGQDSNLKELADMKDRDNILDFD